MNENDIIKEVTALVENVHKLRAHITTLKKRHWKAMEVLRNEPDATEAASQAWDILNGDGR